ncbi:phosphotransferase [Leisingera sp. ANG-M7]|uniref:phosphotransferase n=1 Tax=Leisingera sp. ANG-M7 TaxID=1577902 RepID=UPI00057D1C67|nr:phosphotransferase [Leisingera sp. ANG-M7]KIC35600.1 choline kinase [Leisingera sp. ANG-M7]
MSQSDLLHKIRALPIWQGDITVAPLKGGITNENYLVEDSAGKYVVRAGDDIPLHQVLRFNELAASRAAHAAGLSPAVLHAEVGLTVLEFIESRTLTEKDVGDPAMLPRVLELVKSCHRDVPGHLRGPALVFWVFHVIRDYAATLRDMDSSHAALALELAGIGSMLEQEAGPFDIVFGHNDLLCGNFLDDGERLWLIDFDYAGFDSPLFDLGGLASNNGLSQAQEQWLLESYFEAPVTDDLLHRYSAMKCASLLRETMWSMVSEITSEIDFDYAAYTASNLARFRAALDDFQNT